MTEKNTKVLDKLNQQKEEAFQRKQAISNQIAEKIAKISEHRKQRNALTKQVRQIKKDRDVLNTQITEKIAEIKKHRPKTKIELPKDNRGRPIKPGGLKAKIDLLETKLETEPMKFDAEQKLTKQIKDIQKQYNAIKEASGMSGELKEKSKAIDQMKKDANEVHARVTVIAKESQHHHESMLNFSKDIDVLKKEEDVAYQEFLKHKEEYVKLAGDAKSVQTEIKKAKKAKQAAERKKKEAADQKTLQQRAKEAEKKMMSGQKLTTEDLLALQSLKE